MMLRSEPLRDQPNGNPCFCWVIVILSRRLGNGMGRLGRWFMFPMVSQLIARNGTLFKTMSLLLGRPSMMQRVATWV
jgi:hypothetical protein